MHQVVRSLTTAAGFLAAHRVLVCDHDLKWSARSVNASPTRGCRRADARPRTELQCARGAVRPVYQVRVPDQSCEFAPQLRGLVSVSLFISATLAWTLVLSKGAMDLRLKRLGSLYESA